MGHDAFSESTRRILASVYDADELTALESDLASPGAALHVRCNVLRRDRDDIHSELQAHPALNGFLVERHPLLWDVLVIRRGPCAACLASYCSLESVHATSRFAERKQRGLPPHELFVDIGCAEAVLKGADIFVRGVRGASAGLESGASVSVYADLHGALLRGSVCESLEGMSFIGIGTCCLDRPAIFRESSGRAVRMQHVVAGDLPSLSGLLEGLIYVQNLPSLVVAHVLDAKPGEAVLDMCAAPGSKTTHVATNFLRDEPTSTLIACERNHGKLAKLHQLCHDTFGLRCVSATRADSTRLARQGEPSRIPGLTCELGSFDRILLDPPCSALGLRPRLVLSAAGFGAACGALSIAKTAAYQRLFLWVAVQLLKPGGVLVYSTCTLTAEENEAQVAHALDTHPCLELVPAEPRLGSCGRIGLGLSAELCALVQRFEPAAGGEGFFIAKFRKRDDPCADDEQPSA